MNLANLSLAEWAVIASFVGTVVALLRWVFVLQSTGRQNQTKLEVFEVEQKALVDTVRKQEKELIELKVRREGIDTSVSQISTDLRNGFNQVHTEISALHTRINEVLKNGRTTGHQSKG